MLEAPPDVLDLLGHPIRWRLVRSLSGSDLRVGELVNEVGGRQNLVSYHLARLRRARLVVERRSSSDARDIYYTLDLTRLARELDRSAGAVHPVLGVARTWRPPKSREGCAGRVLFVCTGNSARSLMAEAILRALSQGAVEAQSAGLRPAGIHPLTVRALGSLGIGTDGLRSKGMNEVSGVTFDHVVTLCDIAREECPELPARPRLIHWSLPDPAARIESGRARLAAFRQTALELKTRIDYALPLFIRGRSPRSGAA